MTCVSVLYLQLATCQPATLVNLQLVTSSPMSLSLTEDQKAQVAKWVAEGASLAEVQKRLASELSISLTYMDTRFLLDDLNLTVKDAAKKTAITADLTKTPPPAAGPGEPVPGAGKVRVAVDKIVRPGSALSGSVTFSDGQSAEWHLDQAGRLGLVPKTKGYQPKPPDLQEFQYALQDELARLGY
jgi:hypothetical protein